MNWPYRKICETSKLPYSNLMRWKERVGEGGSPILRPGPKKEQPLEIGRLEEEIKTLEHRQKRTHGTTDLYARYRDQVSRRQLQAMVRSVRDELKRGARASKRRVQWAAGAFVWSMDDSLYARSDYGAKLMLHAVQDLGSQRKFDPLVGDALAKGPEIAENLRSLFEQNGAPLFIKRDNHGNLNSQPVEEVLNEFWVLPLNSPPHYPPYNGAVERGIRELKETLAEQYGCMGFCPQRLRACAPLAVRDLNHKKRRSLRGDTACHVFSDGAKSLQEYNPKRRKEVYRQLMQTAGDINKQLDAPGVKPVQAAWRIAAENWLQRNGLIVVYVPGEVLPIFQ